MQGDIPDIRGRLRAVLPVSWFSDQSPNLNAILTCIAAPWSWLFGLTQYVISQARVASASGEWLDLISLDFFGYSQRRADGELDQAYRERIQWALVRESVSRAAFIANIIHLTGFAPRIFEPANCADTGAYGIGGIGSIVAPFGLAYGVAGGWGTLQLPFQFFVDVRRPMIQGVSFLAGYGTGFGGYGYGPIAYIDLALLAGTVSDATIQRSLAGILPVTAVAWLRIS